jgi:hypothetical protein
MPDAQNIDEVVEQLGRIVANATASGSRIGLFAALYHKVTLRVRAQIAAGGFDDGPRMARFDTTFASRYLDALEAWENDEGPSKCWQLAFDATRRTDLITLQHLLLGINAHVNLDLGIAAAVTCPGAQLASLRGDFDKINQILASLVDEVKGVLQQFSPMIKLLEEIDNSAEDALINFSMDAARDDAWQHATLLAAEPAEQQRQAIAIIDDKAAFLGHLIADPGRVLTAALDAVHLRESDDIVSIIEALDDMP